MKTACLGKSGSYPLWHKMLSTSRIAVLFDHQYLWMESIDTFDLVHEDNHQPKVGSETTSFGRVWPGVPLVQSECRIL